MPFQSLTKQKIKDLADSSAIYYRGENYFNNGDVNKIWLEGNKLFAKVLGSYDEHYKVEIDDEGGKFVCHCSCPYDGLNCKHIVAVCLTFLEDKEKILQEAKQLDRQQVDIREKLLLLNKKELADLLMLSLKIHTNWKNVFLKNLAKRLNKAGFSDGNQQIYQEEFFDYFKRVCEILQEHNQYGGGPEAEENEVYDKLEEIRKLFKDSKLNLQLKREFTDKMFFYYDWDNSGLSDMIIDAVFEIASADEDWRYIIEKLQAKDSDWRREMIVDIYRNHLKDEASYLKLREQSLKWGRNYYDLVDFWTEKGEIDKAIEIAKQGVEKCEGSSDELLEYLYNYYKKQNYLLALDYLKKIYVSQAILENYKRLKNFSQEEDWQQLDGWCRNLLLKEKSFYQLAHIYQFNKEYDKVLDYVLSDLDKNWSFGYGDKEEFADKLIDKYPAQLLPFYEQKMDRYINNMSRKNYQSAARYAMKIKDIYYKYLKQKDEWGKFISKIRAQHANKPALLDEFQEL